MNAEELSQLAQSVHGPLFCLLIASARWLTFGGAFAAYGWAGINRGIVRTAIALSLALPMTLILIERDQAALLALSAGSFALLVAKEALVGFFLGLLASVPIWVADLSGGILAGIRQDPGGEDKIGSTSFGQAFVLIAIGLLVWEGGFHAVLSAVYRSYEFWPVTGAMPQFDDRAARAFLELLGIIFRAAVLVAAPFVLIWLVIDIWLGVSSRIAQRFDLSQYSDVLKALVTMALLILLVGPISENFKDLFIELGNLPDLLASFFRASP